MPSDSVYKLILQKRYEHHYLTKIALRTRHVKWLRKGHFKSGNKFICPSEI